MAASTSGMQNFENPLPTEGRPHTAPSSCLEDPVGRSEVMQWLLFHVGHIGPMMVQAMYFQHIAAPNGHEEPFAVKRYVEESRRLLEVTCL